MAMVFKFVYHVYVGFTTCVFELERHSLYCTWAAVLATTKYYITDEGKTDSSSVVICIQEKLVIM